MVSCQEEYKYKILDLLNDFILIYIDCLSSLEDSFSNEFDLYFDSLFTVNTVDEYMSSIDNIKKYINISKIKEEIQSQKETTIFEYKEIEEYICNEIKSFINKFNLSTKPFDYEIDYHEVDEYNESSLVIEYENIDYLDLLIIELIELIPNLRLIIDTYSIYNIQDIEFTKNEYSILDSCFTYNQDTKVKTVNIKDVYEKLISVKSIDLFDILSDDYITYVLTLIECLYFICSTNIKKPSNFIHNPKSFEKHFNLYNGISINIRYYLDYISISDDNVFVELYATIYNAVNSIDKKEISSKIKMISERKNK